METPCTKWTKAGSIAMCFGCQQSFCTRHFIKHRSSLAGEMDELHGKYDSFQQDLARHHFEQPFLSSIYGWERKSIQKIQEIAEKAREDLQQWADKTKTEVNNSLNEITAQLRASEETDNFTELDLHKWTKRLEDLRNLLEKPANLSLVQDKKASSTIRGIKLVEQSLSSPCSQESISGELFKAVQERFVSIFGPCQLSEEDRVVTHSDYRAGLSQISGHQCYSSGKHSVDFSIEKKGTKNIFLGIHSGSKQKTSSTFDHSVHGWWNFDYAIINGESQGGDKNEIIKTGDRLTFIIDCDQQQIQLKHQQSKRLVRLPIRLEVCPFPWKILVRLLASGDSLRIL